MIWCAVVDEFVGIVFLFGLAGLARRARSRPRTECPGISEPHKFPLWRTGSDEQNGKNRKKAFFQDGVFNSVEWLVFFSKKRTSGRFSKWRS